jgi:hypothetical protein
MGRYTFLQLNMAFNRELYERYVSLFDLTSAKYYSWAFTSVLPWLKQELKRAADNDQKVVLLVHDWVGLKVLLAKPAFESVAKAIDDAPVIAVLAGHLHSRSGRLDDPVYGPGWPVIMKRRNIPVLYSASPHYQKFLDLQFSGDGSGFDFQVIDFKEGRPLECAAGTGYMCGYTDKRGITWTPSGRVSS